MSSGAFLSMELLSLSILDEHIKLMTDYVEPTQYDARDDLLLLHNNFKNGFVILVMLNNYVESCCNTIIREIYELYDSDPKTYQRAAKDYLKAKIEYKIEHIYDMRGKSDIFIKLKDSHLWREFNKMKKERNDLIHYKYNFAGYGIPTVEYRPLCCKTEMTKLKSDIISFCKRIIHDTGFQTCPHFSIWSNDGISCVSYISTKTQCKNCLIGVENKSLNKDGILIANFEPKNDIFG